VSGKLLIQQRVKIRTKGVGISQHQKIVGGDKQAMTIMAG
jgi:hypothetical protein